MTWLTDKVDDLNNPDDTVVPTRSLNVAFQPSLTRYTLVGYTIQQVQAEGNDGSVELRCDAVATPTTSRCSARCAVASDGAATPAVTTRTQLVFLVPPAHYVKLVSAGSGTPTVIEQFEVGVS